MATASNFKGFKSYAEALQYLRKNPDRPWPNQGNTRFVLEYNSMAHMQPAEAQMVRVCMTYKDVTVLEMRPGILVVPSWRNEKIMGCYVWHKDLEAMRTRLNLFLHYLKSPWRMVYGRGWQPTTKGKVTYAFNSVTTETQIEKLGTLSWKGHLIEPVPPMEV